MKLLALDPGGTTGFSIFQHVNMNTWEKVKQGCRDTKENRQELFDLLRTVMPDILVVENFKMFPWKSTAQAWSLFEAVRIIGSCELWADTHQIPLHLQTTGNRDIGYKWGQVRRVPKSNPTNHAYDAEAHAAYYIIKNGGRIK